MAEDKDWVANRQPCSKDADYKGLVEIRGMTGYKFVPWSFVPKGVSWRHTEEFGTFGLEAGHDYGSGTNESLLSSYAAGSFTGSFGADCPCDCSCDSSGF
jgi:hypothetical protein